MDEGERRALTLLLRSLGARRLSVQPLPAPADADHARRQRPILTDDALLLPSALDFATARAAVAHAAAHLCHSTPHQPAGTLKPISLLVIASVEDARVERLLARRLPGVRAWFLHGLREQAADGLALDALLGRLGRALADERWADPNPWVHKARTLFACAEAAHGLHDAAPFRALAAVLANDLGQMRVRIDTRQFVPPFAYRDDHSWLWAHAATAAEPTPRARPDTPGNAAAPPPPEASSPRRILYGEWNYRSHHMRADWCTVMEHSHVSGANAWPVTDYPRLALGAAPQGTRRQRLRRQREGDTLDLDACIRWAADLRTGQPPDARLFERRPRRAEPAALLVLMDLSQSTLDAVPGGGATLLALARQAALALAVAGRATGDRVAVHGFSSNTRHAVAYTRLLEAGDPLDTAALARIAAAPARHSTRLGAALRHATTLLAGARAARRALFVLTDGQPSDIDVHDHRYLTEDARHAVREAAARGVTVLGLGTDASAAPELRRIFGRHARVAATARRLPEELLALYALGC
ncbi:MAG: VWA domain-containing protein [Ottowia sp.]|uniref:nitric oxide reductase activation protein NorD n=1 Tax=Ottowia sp. TaxID=1898956 RepID=UPI0039E46434